MWPGFKVLGSKIRFRGAIFYFQCMFKKQIFLGTRSFGITAPECPYVATGLPTSMLYFLRLYNKRRRHATDCFEVQLCSIEKLINFFQLLAEIALSFDKIDSVSLFSSLLLRRPYFGFMKIVNKKPENNATLWKSKTPRLPVYV